MYHLIYIHTHDSGRFISPYGYAMPTPHLMKFAQESLLFRNAHCVAPTCSPSRSGMLTGVTAHNSGMLGLAHRGFSLTCPEHHLSFFLRNHGFHTALAGVQHETNDVSTLGYDTVLGSDVFDHRYYRGSADFDASNASLASDYIRNYSDEKPLFLSFGMHATHRPYPDPDDCIDPNYVQVPHVIADTSENRTDMAGYMRSVQSADSCFGSIIQALKDRGLYDQSLILFTTDHGIAMPFMKCNLYDTGTGVAMIMRHPERKGSGKVSDSLVSQIDVFPTVCDFLGLKRPEYLQGKSLMPLFDHPDLEINSEIYAEVTYHAAYEPVRSVRTKDYKLIKFYDYHNGYVPANMDASQPKSYVIDCGLLRQCRDREMLFDLRLDPLERINLIGNPNYQDVYNQLSQKLEQHMVETEDPLIGVLHRVPAPEHSRINRLQSIQPSQELYE